MHILKSKVAIVVCGALLIGTISGALAAFSAAPPSTAAPAPSLAQASATAGATATSTPTGAPATPNPTAAPTSTRPVCSTPTPAPSGAQLSLHGRVISVDQNASTFVLRISCGGMVTVTVNDSTKWPGQATSLSTLQPDMQADVQGTSQGSDTLTASSVDAQIDN